MRQTAKDQAYRRYIINYLTAYIESDTCHKLLLGSDDDEIALSFSPYEKKHVRLKAIHIADAIKNLAHHTACEKEITWIQCCQLAVDKNYGVIKFARTVASWYLHLHEYPSLKFRRSERGKHDRLAKSPFLEDELLTMQFKTWARQDLEHLSIKKSHEFINNTLLASWTAQQLQINKISFPVSEHIVGRWMKETGFKYEQHKKSYYVDRHEDPDVIQDHKTYLSTFFAEEIYEYCWMQVTRRQYLTMKYKKKLQTVRVKKEKDSEEDMVMKINKYIEEHTTHFYTAKFNGVETEMVELHVDMVYSYSDTDKNLPPLPTLGGNASVRLPEGQKPWLVFD